MKKLIQGIMLFGIAFVFALTATSSMGASRQGSSQGAKKRARTYYKTSGSSREATSTSQQRAFEGQKVSPGVSGSQEPGGASNAPAGEGTTEPPTSAPPTTSN